MIPVADNKNSLLPSWWIVTSLFLLAVGLRWHQLDRALGGGDENQVLLEFVYSPIDYIVTTFSHGSGGHHIFHTIILRMMVVLFGEENTLAIRFPAFSAGLACLWLIYKIAQQVFPSHQVPRLTLLIAVICPVHIYYSQTARGYSFVMLFTTLAMFSTLQILKSKNVFLWGTVLFLSGFLAFYTQPLTLIFLLGLALWILAVLTVPSLRADFEPDLGPSGKKFLQFLYVFLTMAGASLLAYWPLKEGIMQSADKEYNVSSIFSSSWDLAIHFIPDLFLKIFPGPLIGFIPFCIVGIFFGKTIFRSIRSLPIIILLTTYLVSLATGLAWFPRSYLFNLPLILIFTAAGMIHTGQWLKDKFKIPAVGKFFLPGLICLYAVISLKIIFLDHYPSIKTHDGKAYQLAVKSNASLLDFISIADSKNFLYARSVFKENIQNIIAQNKLDRLKIITPESLALGDYELPSTKGMWPIFRNLKNPEHLDTQNVTGGKKIITVSGAHSIPLLPDDFEASEHWKILAGNGKLSSEKENKIIGEHSLLLEANTKQDLIVQAIVPGVVQIDRPQWVLLIWIRRNLNPKAMSYHPLVGGTMTISGKPQNLSFMMGKMNNGINVQLKGGTKGLFADYWTVNSSLGQVMPGTFSFNISLKCDRGETVLYDGFRLFLLDLPEG